MRFDSIPYPIPSDAVADLIRSGPIRYPPAAPDPIRCDIRFDPLRSDSISIDAIPSDSIPYPPDLIRCRRRSDPVGLFDIRKLHPIRSDAISDSNTCFEHLLDSSSSSSSSSSSLLLLFLFLLLLLVLNRRHEAASRKK